MNEDFKNVRRYKLTNEQIEIYMWLKQQNINTDDGTFCYWVKTYTSKRIQEVVDFAKARRNAGQEIQNIGGWIQRFLKQDIQVVDENCRINQAFLMKFLEHTKWKDIKIYEKYIKDMVTGDDLPLNMEINNFKRSLETLYHKSQLYK